MDRQSEKTGTRSHSSSQMYEERKKPSLPESIASKGEDQISAPTDRIDDGTLDPREEDNVERREVKAGR
jgi:hypothetical protein